MMCEEDSFVWFLVFVWFLSVRLDKGLALNQFGYWMGCQLGVVMSHDATFNVSRNATNDSIRHNSRSCNIEV